MYAYNNFECLLRYKLESVLFDILIEKFCLSNQVPYKPVCKWYKDTRNKVISVQILGASSPEADMKEILSSILERTSEVGLCLFGYRTSNLGGYAHE